MGRASSKEGIKGGKLENRQRVRSRGKASRKKREQRRKAGR